MFSFFQSRLPSARPEKSPGRRRSAGDVWWPGPETRVQRVGGNTIGRDFVIGDLHGCLEPLGRLMAHVRFHQGRDRLFSVGDLVDRGPQSMDCLRLLEMPWFHCVLGNHEQMLIRHLEDPYGVKAYDEGWLMEQAHKFSERAKFAAKWLPKLKRLPLVMLAGQGTSRFGVVHAELIEQGRSVSAAMVEKWNFTDPRRAMRSAVAGRRLIRSWRDGRHVGGAHDASFPTMYCGHTVVARPMRVAGHVYLDTGAFVGHEPGRPVLRARPVERAGTEETALAGKPGLAMALAGSDTVWLAPTVGGGVREVSIDQAGAG